MRPDSLPPLASPYPYFGGKRKIAAAVWERFGAVDNYVEPFFGSGAVLLARPGFRTSHRWIETVNDADGFIANFWRALRADPEQTAWHADHPVIEADLEARHGWLVRQREDLTAQLQDPDFFDCKIAGWWVWGISAWIGSGWCAGKGPWHLQDGRLVKAAAPDDAGRGIHRQLPHLGDAGQGIHRQLPHLGNAGRGIHRQRPHLGNAGRGILGYFETLATRLRDVRVCGGDWSRVCGDSVTHGNGVTAVFLDPPYADTAGRDKDIYAKDCLRVAHDVREWAIAHGNHPLLRIALCGYEGEHAMPADWSVLAWNAGQGYGGQAQERSLNGRRERIWLSPHCLPERQTGFLMDFLP